MRVPAAILAVLAISLTTSSLAQNIAEKENQLSTQVTIELANVPPWLKTFKFEQSKFTFVRIKYDSIGRFGRNGSWSTDYPDADLNFAIQLGKFTKLDVSEPSRVLRLTNPELKKHPFIYIAEPSSMALSGDEVVALRDYLNGGGFLLVDDFWGDPELEDVRRVFEEVFPDRKARDLSLEHPLFHCVFDLKEKPQVPSIHAFLTKSLDVKSASPRYFGIEGSAKYYGIEDDNGRVMVLMCHNTDLADGWERAEENGAYKREISEAKAFPMGFNIVYYALTGGKAKASEK